MNHAKPFLVVLLIALCGIFTVIEAAIASPLNQNTADMDMPPLALTATERAWIARHPDVTVGVKSGWMPIEFRLQDESNRGVSLDYLNAIAKLTGLRFTWVHKNDNHVDAKKIQIISGVTGHFDSNDYTVTDDAYLHIPYAIYVNQAFKNRYQRVSMDDLENSKVAIYKNGQIAETISQHHPTIDLVYVDIADEAFEYLQRNQIQAYIGSELVIDYHIAFHRIKFAKKSSLTPYHSEVRMAVRNDEQILRDIMNKAIKHIGTNNPNILDKWKTTEPQTQPVYIVLVLGLSCILFVVVFRLMVERKKAKLAQLESQQRTWYQANYDLQTGLPNRNFYETKIQDLIKQAEQQGAQFALLFIDIDNFKNINDVSGHSTGDRVLKEVGQRLKDCLKEQDFIARLGGDEFVILIQYMDDLEVVDAVCQTLLNFLRLPFRIHHQDYFISATIGVSLYPQHAADVEDLLSFADQAMYEGKKLGKDRFIYFSKRMQDDLNNKISIVNELRNALTSDQFELVYQPILDLNTLECTKVEALIRWHHPERGLIAPDQFISIAEETGLIHQLGGWIFNRVIQDILVLQAQLPHLEHNMMVCVNLSPLQFTQPQYLDDFVLALEQQRILPNCICFEITEGLLLDASKSVLQTIDRLKAHGIRFSIDDFGTGYSALAYLKKLDIDYVKIDKSFIKNIDQNNNNRILCESIILMSHKLNIHLIAEGVEEQIQEDILRGYACDYIQGYLHGKPMALQTFIQRELESYIAKHYTLAHPT